MAAGLHVSIAAETVLYIGNLAVTNSMLTSIIVTAVICFVAVVASSKLTDTSKPKGLQNVLEMIVEGLFNLTQDITQNRKTSQILFPLTTTFFIFIWLNNWSGLLPGVGTIGVSKPIQIAATQTMTPTAYASEDTKADSQTGQIESSPIAESPIKEEHETKFIPIFRAATADLNTTIALALISVLATQVIGVKYLGLSYFKKFFNFKNPIFAFVGILELISEIAKVISFAFRLFGNIFAGEVLLVVIAFLLPILAPVPFLGLELFVGVIQALVFTMLSLVFMSMATHAHEEEH